ncbi:MAG TPA: hypothetical protein VLR71_07115 [Casimicrobiaceae bacterium]|nr:hypothetical protein [Casimicrobiaceae bacterium]
MRATPHPTGIGTRAWTARWLALLGLLLAAHAVLIGWVVAGLLPESTYNPVDTTNLRQVSSIAAAALVAVAFAARRPAPLVALGVLATAVALLSPGPVLIAAWIVFDAWLAGRLILQSVARSGDSAGDVLMCTLTGLALVVGVLCATARMSIHYPAVYAALLCVPLAALVARPRLSIDPALGAAEAPRWTAAERLWLGVLGVVLVLHVFVVAKPEVGYDAQAVHLAFARLLAAEHAWSFDVQRYAWAEMPLGADWVFALADALGGEACARFLNLVFGLVAGGLLLRLVGMGAPRLPALVSVALFASAPLTFLVTGSLFSETLWCAFLLGTLVAALAWLRSRAPVDLAALLLTAAGALQCKAISLLWLAPLGIGLVVLSRGGVLRLPGWPLRACALIACAIGAWPYVHATWDTGNPVFPFFNSVFRSPLFPREASFTNALYHATLWPWAPYQLVTESQRFIEGVAGAPGFHWLLVIPFALLALTRMRLGRWQWGCMALGAVFFVAVFVQQAYLRYLLPALLLAAAVGGWTLASLPDRRSARLLLGTIALALIALNLRFMYTASWYHATLCRRCTVDAHQRQDYVARYAPLRIVAEWLNEHLPDARIGFFVLNDASPAGYVGYSRGGNWHDLAVYPDLSHARTAGDVLAIARRWNLTHVVVHVNGTIPEEAAITAFRDQDTQPVWQFENYRVAVVAPAAEREPAVSARR